MKLYDKKTRLSEKHVKADQLAMEHAPSDIWRLCPKCHHAIFNKKLGRYCTCPYCHYGFRIGARQRLEWLVDDFDELDFNLPVKDPLNFPGYKEKIAQCRQNTKIDESIITGIARINNVQFALGIMDPGFIMGSLGSITGAKITHLFQKANAQHLAVVIFTSSGGARMQEGIYSLMQMQKISQIVATHAAERLFYLTVLTDPTTGGVTASFATQSDIILAEPHALIGFAGRRVIEQTMHQKIPDDLQSAETLYKNGFIDQIIERENEKEVIAQLIKLNQ